MKKSIGLCVVAFLALSGSAIAQSITVVQPTVSGPASATSGHIATFNGTTGQIIQDGGAVPTSAPCSSFGTTAGTCAQGGVITAGGPTGSATVAPIITYNAAGQVTAVSSATITPAVSSITGLGTGAATLLGGTASGTGGVAGTTSAVLTTPELTGSSTGVTTLASANAGASNFTLTFPAITDTVVTLTATQTITHKTLNISGGSFSMPASGQALIYANSNVFGLYGNGAVDDFIAGNASGNDYIEGIHGGQTMNFPGYLSCTSLTTNGSGLLGCTASDRRLKKPEGSVSDATAILDKIPAGQVFQYKDQKKFDGLVHIGLYAQDVCKADSRLCHMQMKGGVQFNYEDRGIISLLVESEQEQKRQIAALRAANDNLSRLVAQIARRK